MPSHSDPVGCLDSGARLRHRFCPVSRVLRVGVLLPPGPGIGRWATKVLDALDGERALACSLLQVGPDATDPKDTTPLVLRLLRDRAGAASDPFARVPLVGVTSGSVTSLGGDDPATALSLSAREAVRARAFDVVVWLGDDSPPRWCADLARLGLWSFRFGDPESPLVRPFYWREIVDGDSVSVVLLQRHAGNGEAVETIAVDAVPTQTGWYFTRNAEQPTALAAPLLIHALLDAARDEERFLSRIGPPAPGRSGVRTPSVSQLARFLWKRVRHSIRSRVSGNSQARRADWLTAMRKRSNARAEGASRAGFRNVPAAPQVQYADPFLCENEGRHWLFMEEMPSYGAPARLVCAEVHDDLSVDEKVVILEKPYHLSYPCVFQHDGTFYMVPESGEDNSVQLHAATKFPFEWRLESLLCEGLPFRDTTPFLHDGVWYFFTTLDEMHTETFLFTSERLHGPWRYHPCNPVCSGSRRSRGAGHLFYRGTTLIRPSQDCSVRYGYAIVLNEVLRLTPTEYEEQPVETILPDWRTGLLGTHTINRDAVYEVIDESRAVGAST